MVLAEPEVSLANNKQKIAKDKNPPYSPFFKGGHRGIQPNNNADRRYPPHSLAGSETV